MRIHFISSLCFAVISCGCTLDAIPEFGEKCPPEGKNGEVLGDYLPENGFCQKDNLCLPVGTTGQYICTTKCGTIDDEKEDDLVFCAQKCLAPFPELHISACNLEDDYPECEEGYDDCDRKVQTGCETSLNSLENCGACGESCTTQSVENSVDVKCSQMTCLASKCRENYHLVADGKCEKDSDEACTDPDTGELVDCSSANHAAAGVCQSGKCEITLCQSGYHVSGEGAGNTCIENTDEVCGDDLVNCIDLPYTTSGAFCNLAEGYCEFDGCLPNYHVKNHVCTKDTTDECGDLLIACESPEHGSASCVGGYCSFDCAKDYHRKGDECEADTLINCGEHDVSCSTESIPHSTNVACKSGSCMATVCETGYHVYNGICEENSYQHCGEHGSRCPNSHCRNALVINQSSDVNYSDDKIICVTGEVTVGPSIKTVTMNNLVYAGGFNIKYENNQQGVIQSLTLPKLEVLNDQAVYINGSNSTNVWNCGMVILNATKLTKLSLPNLKETKGAFFIRDNQAMTSISLPSLETSRSFVFGNLNSVYSIQMPSLKNQTGSFYIIGDPLITSFDLPALTKAGSISISGNKKLSKLNFNYAKLDKIEVHDNPALSCANMCSLKNYGELNSGGVKDNAEKSCNLKWSCP
ncbi:MAG: hypothetical protein J6A01_04930 [Proteobacteria bacterium]|nr:hypothetical protein [Pseudomonadota bacterium]